MTFRDPNVPTGPGDLGGLGGGGGGTGPQNFKTPAAARDVNVVILQVGLIPSFRISWTDEQVASPDLRTVDYWHIRYVTEKVAGTISNESDFPTKALGLSRSLNTVSSSGEGGVLSYVHTEAGLEDGYVMVLGVKNFIGGPVSQPWLLRLQSTSLVVSPDITDQDATLFVETLNGADYFNFTPEFTSPSDVAVFKGVQIYWDPYPSDLAEMGNVDVFTGTVGGFHQVSPFRRFPLTGTLGSGTLDATAADTAVVRNTGTAFDVGWVGRSIFIEFAGGWAARLIASVTDTDNMDVNVALPDTGTFRFAVIPSITAYFVSVSIFGTRRSDITASPTVVLS